jgi:hypothetical protein
MSTPDELRAQAAALLAQAAEVETPMTKEDVHQLMLERRYDDVVKAKKDGRLAGLLGPINPNKEN